MEGIPHIHTYIATYIYTYIHTYIHRYIVAEDSTKVMWKIAGAAVGIYIHTYIFKDHVRKHGREM